MFDGVKEEFKLKDKYIIGVTDCGSNVVRATDIAGIESHRCWGHALHNLITRDGIQEVPALQYLQKKVRKIISSLRYKQLYLEEMEQEQQSILDNLDILNEIVAEEEAAGYDQVIEIEYDVDDENGIEEEIVPNQPESDETSKKRKVSTTLKLDVVTRWNSFLLMLQSLGSNKSSVTKLLKTIDSPHTISVSEWNEIQNLTAFLKNFEKITEVLSMQKSTSINVCLLIRSEITDLLEENTGDHTSPTIEKMKEHMRAKLDHRFPVTHIVVLAALLDPRYFNLRIIDTYMNETSQTKVTFLKNSLKKYKCLENYMQRKNSADLGNERTIQIPSTSNSNPAVYVANLTRKHSNLQSPSNPDILDAECNSYLALLPNALLPEDDILQFWKTNANIYPHISALVRKILNVPATSTPAERVFSIAGLTITKKRSLLNPMNVDRIIFVHDNYGIFKDLPNQ